MNIAIVGDSFSSDSMQSSWISLLEQTHKIKNYSARGISQYRLYKILIDNFIDISAADCVILFHTNPDRIFIPDHINYTTRELQSHPYCDMLANDACNSQWSEIAKTYYKYFFDTKMQQTFYQLLVNEINQKLSSLDVVNCSGFDAITTGIDSLVSFADIRQQYPGDINHFSIHGNTIACDRINQQLEQL